jgi:hypothetical protein
MGKKALRMSAEMKPGWRYNVFGTAPFTIFAAALRQIGKSTELLTKQTAETAQPVLGLANGVAKMDSILSGVATESNELLHWAS